MRGIREFTEYERCKTLLGEWEAVAQWRVIMGQKLFRQKYEAAQNYQGADDYDEETFYESMRSSRLELPAYAEEVLQADRKKLYSHLEFDIEMSQWFEDSFPDATFALVLDIIKDPRYLKTRKGWSFVMIFHLEWEKVTEGQKLLLLQTLSEIYEQFEDWMPCFSVSELVGENFDSSQCYEFFKRFTASSNETARAFVPHGFEHALMNSADADLTSTLWKALVAMERDESEKVRGEVEESLYRLANHGLHRPL